MLRGGFYANNDPVLVDPSLFDGTAGAVSWADGASSGSYFSGYNKAIDPQCSSSAVAGSLQGLCNLNALYNTAGDLVFRTTNPGEFGNFRDQIEAPGRWDVDMAISKRIQIGERFAVEARVDATNIFNHPTPVNPNLNVQNGTEFGNIDGKSGTSVQFAEFGRVFQARIRIDW